MRMQHNKNLPDGVTRAHTDPLRNGSVLLQLLGKLLLDAQDVFSVNTKGGVTTNTSPSSPCRAAGCGRTFGTEFDKKN